MESLHGILVVDMYCNWLPASTNASTLSELLVENTNFQTQVCKVPTSSLEPWTLSKVFRAKIGLKEGALASSIVDR